MTFFILISRHRSMKLQSAALVAGIITVAFLVAYAAWYWVQVKKLTGTWHGAWSLPDGATVDVDADPERALSHVLTLAEVSFPWLRSTLADGTLTLTRKSSLWGRLSVEVVATATNGGTQLRLRARSPQLAPNLTARAMIARLSAEIASDHQWRQM